MHCYFLQPSRKVACIRCCQNPSQHPGCASYGNAWIVLVFSYMREFILCFLPVCYCRRS